MFSDRGFFKKREKRPKPQKTSSPEAVQSVDPASARSAFDGPIVQLDGETLGIDDCQPTVQENGVTIEDYAAIHSSTQAAVWKRLRHGDLIGRTYRGQVLIYGDPEVAVDTKINDESSALATSAEDELAAASLMPVMRRPTPIQPTSNERAASLPPLPPTDERPTTKVRPGASKGLAAAGSYLALSGEQSQTPELALLLDHLSLAKEENREILRLTQDSIRKVTELTDSIVEMKDQVIDAKETQIETLREQLAQQSREVRKLKQQNEDLEMLARTMVDRSQD